MEKASGLPRNARRAVAALALVVALAAVGAVAARGIRSPAQIAADTAPPRASLISVPVEQRLLATEVIVRGTVRYGAPQEVVLPVSALKTSTSLVSSVPRQGARLDEGQIAAVISGRPVFVFQGATPMHRDLGPGAEGEDVRQLEQALARAGLAPGSVDGRYDGATAAAVAAYYVRRNEAPFGATDIQAEGLRTAAATAAAARDALLQTRLALRTAARGTLPADVNQGRLDVTAAAEAVPVARLAIATAQGHASAARAAIAGARLAEAEATSAANRDIPVADADVTTKRAAVDEAVETLAQAQRNLAGAPPETTAEEYETLRAAVRLASGKVEVARADLYAAEKTAETARSSVPIAVGKARNDADQAAHDVSLAEAETRSARASLAIAERKLVLARMRVRILRRPPDTALEREIVGSAQLEAGRTRGELAKLAVRTGVQVPADEVLFFPTLPLRVDSLTARRGSQVLGSLMTVTNSRLAIDSSLSIADAKLVRPGMRVRIEETDLQVRARGSVSQVAAKPGTPPADLAVTTPVDPARVYIEVVPEAAPASLVGTSVKLSIAVESTQGKVLAVPIGALSVAADGTSRVQVDRGGRTRFVTVVPGLAAQGFVEVTPTRGGRLEAGDLVVVGSGPSSAAKAPTEPVGTPAPNPADATGGGGGSVAPESTVTAAPGTAPTPQATAPGPAPGPAPAPAASTSPSTRAPGG
jgi:hypothetical protein